MEWAYFCITIIKFECWIARSNCRKELPILSCTHDEITQHAYSIHAIVWSNQDGFAHYQNFYPFPHLHGASWLSGTLTWHDQQMSVLSTFDYKAKQENLCYSSRCQVHWNHLTTDTLVCMCLSSHIALAWELPSTESIRANYKPI